MLILRRKYISEIVRLHLVKNNKLYAIRLPNKHNAHDTYTSMSAFE